MLLPGTNTELRLKLRVHGRWDDGVSPDLGVTENTSQLHVLTRFQRGLRTAAAQRPGHVRPRRRCCFARDWDGT